MDLACGLHGAVVVHLDVAPFIGFRPEPAAPERPPIPWDRMVLKEEEAAEFLKCAPQTLRRRAAAGEIPRYSVGGEWRYYVYDLLDHVLTGTGDRSGGDPE